MIGTIIEKYRILGQLGRGATGIVYRAFDETLEREVAIKVLNPHLADPEIVKRFRAEATILAKLNHPEIATIHELVRRDTDLLMVMERARRGRRPRVPIFFEWPTAGDSRHLRTRLPTHIAP